MTEARFFDGNSAVGQSVALAIQGADLQISGNDSLLLCWPIATLRRADIDAPGDGATLRQRSGTARLVVADGAFIDVLRARGARLGKAGRRWGATTWGGVGAGIFGGLALAALLVDRLPSLIVPLVPHRMERAWSAGIEAALGGFGRDCRAPIGNAAIAQLVARLAYADGLTPPHFKVLDERAVNAFTLPDGRMVIFRGLIDKAGDSDEFAGVLAHELGHMRHRDPTRETLRRLMLNMLARSLGWGGDIGGQMTALSYGRRAEAAADASAIETLQRAGLRADGLGHFFDRMHKETGSDGLPAFLSDHPSTIARAEALRVGPAGTPAMTADEWSSVRKICSSKP